jgi:hypothetical protein
MRTSRVAFALCFFAISCAVADEVKFAEDQHCVAWRTKKRMMMVKRLEPVGINCAAKTKAIASGEGFVLNLEVPVDQFNSGEPKRDQEVVKLLGAAVSFESQPLTMEKIKSLGDEPQAVSGQLQMNGKKFPVEFQVTAKKAGDWIFTGQVVSKMSAFEVEPPTVGGGMIAKVDDYLELHFQFHSSKIEGFPELGK